MPSVISDVVILGYMNDFIIEQRKAVTQDREFLLAAQKQCGKEDRESARELGQVASELLKEWRGWDAVLGIIEGREGFNDWRKTKIQKEIAPYVDRAFYITNSRS